MLVTGFNPRRMTDGSMYLPSTQTAVIAASAVVKVGSAVKLISSAIDVADATTDSTYGYVVGFVVNYGGTNLPLRLVADNSVYVDGTYVYAVDGEKYTAAADNVTDKKVCAVVMSAENVICSAYLDADAGTTTGSGLVGYFMDIETTAGNAATLLDESTSTTSGDYVNVAGISNTSAIDPSTPGSTRRVMTKAVTIQA